MLRRDILKAIGVGAFAWPIAAQAQQQIPKIPRVGVLWHAGNEEEEAIYLAALKRGLRQMGYIDGRNIELVNRFADEKYERFAGQATELVELKVDAIVASITPAALAAKRVTSSIPVVFVLVPDPVKSELVDSLARPTGNLTGLSTAMIETSKKRLALFKECIPSLSSVAIMMNPSRPDHRLYVEETLAAASVLQLGCAALEIRGPAEIPVAFDTMATDRRDGLVVFGDGLFYNERARIGKLALSHRLPTMMFSRETCEIHGILMSYGPDLALLFERAATYVSKILKGTKPGDLPVERPTKYPFIINAKTAKTLDLSIPVSTLVSADELIE